mgnify:CR=1 FL=1
MTIKVLVVDDSALVRSLLAEIIRDAPDMTLVGAAPDAYVARDMVKEFSPDVITLDIEMPRMDGITFLKKIMQGRPTPVVICSSLTEKGAETTMEAMSAGAVAIFTKPQMGVKGFLEQSKADLLDAIREAARLHELEALCVQVRAARGSRLRLHGGRLGLRGRRRLGLEAAQVGQQAHARHAVDGGVVHLGEHCDPAAGQALDDPHLPQRARAVQRGGVGHAASAASRGT